MELDFTDQRKQLLDQQLSNSIDLEIDKTANINITSDIMSSNNKQKIFAEQNIFNYYEDIEEFNEIYTLNFNNLEDQQYVNKIKESQIIPFEKKGIEILGIMGPTLKLTDFEFDDIIVISREIYNYYINQLKGDIISSDDDVSYKEQLHKLLETIISYNSPDLHIFPIDKNFYTITMRTEIGISTITDRLPKQIGVGILNTIKNKIGIDTSIQIIEAKGKMVESIMSEKRFFRVSIMSSTKGESINIRQLATKDSIQDLNTLNYDEDTIKEIEKVIDYREGIILVTGATGSGKSMLLYTILNRLAKIKNKRILTIENPVEIDMSIDKIIQNDLSETETAKEEFKATTKKLKKAFLRHDPDITLIQEVRDTEETNALFEMAIEGHLALSTLHANSVNATILRLENYLGIHRDTIKSSVRGIINQQLAPRKCIQCNGVGYKQYDQEEICNNCNGIGMKGKIPIYELAIFGEIEEGVDIEELDKSTKKYISKLDCIKIQYKKDFLTYKVMLQLVKQVIKNNQNLEEEILKIEEFKNKNQNQNQNQNQKELEGEELLNIINEEFKKEADFENKVESFDLEVEESSNIVPKTPEEKEMILLLKQEMRKK